MRCSEKDTSSNLIETYHTQGEAKLNKRNGHYEKNGNSFEKDGTGDHWVHHHFLGLYKCLGN